MSNGADDEAVDTLERVRRASRREEGLRRGGSQYVPVIISLDVLLTHTSSIVFALGGHITSALLAYQKALAWESLFALALTEGKRPISEIKELAVEVAATLKLRRRYVEAGRVLLEYGRDVEAAVEALVEGGAFVEAIRLVCLTTLSTGGMS